jgi:hypothetical protein
MSARAAPAAAAPARAPRGTPTRAFRAASGTPASAGSRSRTRPQARIVIPLEDPDSTSRVTLRASIPRGMSLGTAASLLEAAAPPAFLAVVAAAAGATAAPFGSGVVASAPFPASASSPGGPRVAHSVCVTFTLPVSLAAAVLAAPAVALPAPWPDGAPPAQLSAPPSVQPAFLTGVPPHIPAAPFIAALCAAFPGVQSASRDTLPCGVASERYTLVLSCTPAGGAVPHRIPFEVRGQRFTGRLWRQPLFPPPAPAPPPAAAPAAAPGPSPAAAAPDPSQPPGPTPVAAAAPPLRPPAAAPVPAPAAAAGAAAAAVPFSGGGERTVRRPRSRQRTESWRSGWVGPPVSFADSSAAAGSPLSSGRASPVAARPVTKAGTARRPWLRARLREPPPAPP